MNQYEIQEMARGFWKAEALFVATRLELFNCFKDGPKTSGSTARLLNAHSGALSRLLDALVVLKLLKKKEGFYSNTRAAQNYLVKGSGRYIGNSVTHAEIGKINWSRLEESVRTGNPAATEIPEKDLKWRRELFILSMNDHASLSAPVVADSLNLKKYNHILDLACGSGFYAKEFLGRNRNLKVTLFDRPDVIEIARSLLSDSGLGGKLDFVGGDILTSRSFGEGYDGVLLSNICHMLSLRENVSLFKKVRKALAADGDIIIHDQVLRDDKTGPEFAVLFRIHMLLGTKGGDNYSGKEFRDMLGRAGFKTFRKRSLKTGASLIIAK